MKRIIPALVTAAIAAAFFVVPARPQEKANSIERLKSLAGEWTASTAEGEVFTNAIRVVSNGTAIEESFEGSGHQQMVTIYSPDGARVALTHYCSMGNQPRMETSAVTADTAIFEFNFVGATNLASASDAHMHHMILRIADKDHFSETWTMQANGKQQNETFQFVRKKS